MVATRRSLIRTTGIALFGISSAGCLFGQSRGIADVIVHNKTSEKKIVSVVITDISGENRGSVQFRKKFPILPDRKKRFNNKVVYNTDNRVEVHIKNRLSDTWHWNNVSDTLHIAIKDKGIAHWQERD